MSTPTAPTSAVYRWHDDALQLLDYCDMADTTVEAADSWLVSDGRTLALDLHRSRFLAAAPDGEAFWDAAVAAVPREGDWFPRVELQSRSGSPLFVLRLRSAPARTRSVVVATHAGTDPRTRPAVVVATGAARPAALTLVATARAAAPARTARRSRVMWSLPRSFSLG